MTIKRYNNLFFLLAVIFFALYFLLILLLKTVDVAPSGVGDEQIGLSAINLAYAEAIGYHGAIRKASDIAGVLLIGEVFFFGTFGVLLSPVVVGGVITRL